MSHADILKAAFLDPSDLTGGSLAAHSPIDGALIGEVATQDASDVEAMIARARAAFAEWKLVPAPRRGELIRLFGEELRAAKDRLGALVSLEA
jgi:aldehyde dehydrogenase (NAD+)